MDPETPGLWSLYNKTKTENARRPRYGFYLRRRRKRRSWRAMAHTAPNLIYARVPNSFDKRAYTLIVIEL